MWNRILLKKLISLFDQLVKKFPAFFGTRSFIIIFKRNRYWNLSCMHFLFPLCVLYGQPISYSLILSP